MNVPKDIKKEHNRVKHTFFTYFHNQGYKLCPESNLITEDDSILFTNATIIPWKKYISGKSILQQNEFMKQACLRLHVLNDSFVKGAVSETVPERFLGYFNMLGLISGEEQEEILPFQILDLLIEKYKIPKGEIKVFASNDQEFISCLEKEIEIEYNSKNPSFYNWDYCIDGVSGKGATFSLLQKNEEFKEIGQLVQIKNGNGSSFYEFGFGIETFLARSKKEDTYNSWSITSCVPKEYKFKLLLDLFSCFGATCIIPLELRNKRHKREIRRISRRVAKLEKLINIPNELTEDIIDNFIKLEFNITGIRDSMVIELQNARESVKRDEN